MSSLAEPKCAAITSLVPEPLRVAILSCMALHIHNILREPFQEAVAGGDHQFHVFRRILRNYSLLPSAVISFTNH